MLYPVVFVYCMESHSYFPVDKVYNDKITIWTHDSYLSSRRYEQLFCEENRPCFFVKWADHSVFGEGFAAFCSWNESAVNPEVTVRRAGVPRIYRLREFETVEVD